MQSANYLKFSVENRGNKCIVNTSGNFLFAGLMCKPFETKLNNHK